MYSAVKGVNCETWTKGSHARHYTPSAVWPVTALIGLNEETGFTTHYFSLSSNLEEQNKHIFIQMMFDLNYRDRQTWLKTLLLFDITNDRYLSAGITNNVQSALFIRHTLYNALFEKFKSSTIQIQVIFYSNSGQTWSATGCVIWKF